MDKVKLLENYNNKEDKILISKLLDKIEISQKRNIIQITDFINKMQLQILLNILKTIKFKRYILFGGREEYDRCVIIIYPPKLEEMVLTGNLNYNSICNCVRIKNMSEEYEHKVYLSALMKLGIKREKIGDIIVSENTAYIIVHKDISEFIVLNAKDLTRFKNSEISIIDMKKIINKIQEYKELEIIVSSSRLDNFISSLINVSRNNAVSLINKEKVFLNYKVELKNTKLVKENDILVIRGYGKFVILGNIGNTKSGKYVIKVKKYI